MRAHSLEHLSDRDLLHELDVRVSNERSSTADLVACIGEVDARQLYLPAGYSSMYAYCVEKLGLSEGSAYKRIQVGRAARDFPALLEALADGSLNLTGIILLAPHLRPENAGDLIDSARGKACADIEKLLAQRFPRTELLPMVSAPTTQLSARTVLDSGTERTASTIEQAPTSHPPVSRTSPIAEGRFAIQASIAEETHANLVYLQQLLSHRIPSGNLAEVLDWALKAAVRLAERQKFSASSRPQEKIRVSRSRRHVPAAVKREVWERDQNQCSFVSEDGHRCQERAELEFDHVDPVALGGRPTPDRVRLLCRAHNQHEAELVYGAEFMSAARAGRRIRTTARECDRDLVAGLRGLGFGKAEVDQAAAFCADMRTASPEERMTAAIRFLRPRRQSSTG